MLTHLPVPLAVALALSYVGLAMLVTTAVIARRTTVARLQVLIWTVVGVGAVSIAIRTAYFALV